MLGGFGTLEVLRRVAYHRGTASVELPAGSEIRAKAEGADYTDAYRTPLPEAASIESFEFGLGREIARTEQEVVWEGAAPGLRYLASFHLSTGSPPELTLSTVVFYESAIGRAYFFFVRPVHRRGVPFMLSRLGRR